MHSNDIEDIKSIKVEAHKDEDLLEFVKEFINTVGSPLLTPSNDEIEDKFKELCSNYHVHPGKAQVSRVYRKHYSISNAYIRPPGYSILEINSIVKRWLIKRVSRSESGVLVVTIVTKPGENIKFSCPEKCAYCPTETNLAGKPTQPKSYISTEPAMLRALQSDFDIKGQIEDRLRSYLYTGNMEINDKKKKFEVILSGGTWDVMPSEYRNWVINQIYWTFNTYNQSQTREPLSIEEEIKINQSSLYGVIGLTIETRPDYITERTVKQYLKCGITRVQIGVQHYDNNILLKIKRGCTTKDTIKAIRLLKMVGLKVVVHLMPDLPDSSPELDKWMFDQALTNPDLQFDDIKIYPTAIVKSASDDLIIKSEINDWYENGTYKPYAENNINDLVDVCLHYKTKVQPWVRIERLVRDIPSKSIQAGYNKISNFRQILHNKMQLENLQCNCIRCREIKNKIELINDIKLVVRQYDASDGIEYFISYEAENYYWTFSWIWFCILFYLGLQKYYTVPKSKALFGFLRLRIDPTPGGNFVPEINHAGLIREVHVYGISTDVGSNNTLSSQHKGLGQKLVKTAEEIVKSHNLNKVAIIAGVGTREYYQNKCGYTLEGTYMTKYI